MHSLAPALGTIVGLMLVGVAIVFTALFVSLFHEPGTRFWGGEIAARDWLMAWVIYLSFSVGAGAAMRFGRLWVFVASAGGVLVMAMAGVGALTGAGAGAMLDLDARDTALLTELLRTTDLGVWTGAVAGTVAGALRPDGAWAMAIPSMLLAAVTSLLLTSCLRRRALAEDPQLPRLRLWILAVSAWSGTDLRDASLGPARIGDGDGEPPWQADGEGPEGHKEKGADFRGARMAFARLAGPRDLTHADFRGARDLHLAYLRGTILLLNRLDEALKQAPKGQAEEPPQWPNWRLSW